MGRKILFFTPDQQRYDGLGCNGGLIARTPNIDRLASTGINYRRAHPQSVVCMPSRSTMVTGQHVASHGVWMNGVPLPIDAPSVASTLHDAGYSTALIGKAHFEPFMDPFLRGNRDDQPRRGDASITQALALMNDPFVMGRVNTTAANSLVTAALKLSDTDAVSLMYLTVLSRYPTTDELNAALANFKAAANATPRTQEAQNLLWSLYNKVDFIYNY